MHTEQQQQEWKTIESIFVFKFDERFTDAVKCDHIQVIRKVQYSVLFQLSRAVQV